MSTGTSQWPPFEVTSLRSNLVGLRGLARDDERQLEPEIRAWLARMLVVRSAGFIEQTVSECCRQHIRERSGGWVRAFAHSWVERSKNPSADNLLQLLGRFDQSLSDEFEAFISEDDELIRRELGFMVDRRNKIAHGLNEGLNSERAVALSEVAEKVADWFVLKLNPLR